MGTTQDALGAPMTGPRRLVLVRHGETADNVAGRFLGRSDPGLTPAGLEAARSCAGGLDLGGAVVVSSPARRALETAEALGAIDPSVDEGWRELDFGAWEGLTPAEAAVRDPEVFAAFEYGDLDGFPGGESVDAVRARTLDALARHPVDRLVVVTHATVVRIVVTALLDLPVRTYRARLGRPGHLSRTELERHDGGWRLLTYSSAIVPRAGE